MSFRALLKVAGKEIVILNHHYSFSQETDPNGQPSSIVRGGKITITFEAAGDTTFFDWMTGHFERKDGSIVYKKRDSDATLKEVKFKEAYLIGYSENFDSTNNDPLSETITLSAHEIDMGSNNFKNDWTKN